MSVLDSFLEKISLTHCGVVVDDTGSCRANMLPRLIHDTTACLCEGGLASRMRVLLPVRNTIESLLILFGCWHAGAIVFPVHASASPLQLERLRHQVDPHAIILDQASARILKDQLPRQHEVRGTRTVLAIVKPQDTQTCHFESVADVGLMSSGSTGEPKIALHRFSSLLLNASLHAEAISLSHNDIVGASLPLNFSYGLVAALLAPLLTGSSCVLTKPEGLNRGLWAKRRSVSVLSLTPFTARSFIGSKLELPFLRVLTVGGDSMPHSLAKDLLNSIPNLCLYTTYGLSEAGPRVTTCHVTPELLQAFPNIPMGSPLTGVSLDIEGGGITGELVVRTPTAMLGYFRSAETTLSVLSPYGLHTGDFVLREGGQIFFLGRKKRIISHCGEKIFPLIIEESIRRFNGVLDAWVEGEPDREVGQVPVAYVIPRNDELDLGDLRRFLRKHLPGSHIPREFHSVDKFPAHVIRK